MNNFAVRFLYEVFFELMICSLINLTSIAAGGVFGWFISLMTVIVAIVAIAFTISLLCKNGPYIDNTYAQGSFMGSYWGKRELHLDIYCQTMS